MFSILFNSWSMIIMLYFQVSVEGPYDIIYDIVCQTNKKFSSHYRTSVIKKFYLTLQQLNQTDKLLVHINSFASQASNYTLPDTIRLSLGVLFISSIQSPPRHSPAVFYPPFIVDNFNYLIHYQKLPFLISSSIKPIIIYKHRSQW